jgi:hypothetical protein
MSRSSTGSLRPSGSFRLALSHLENEQRVAISAVSIGQVGGVFDKAVAAEKHNITLFLVPYGQKAIV